MLVKWCMCKRANTRGKNKAKAKDSMCGVVFISAEFMVAPLPSSFGSPCWLTSLMSKYGLFYFVSHDTLLCLLSKPLLPYQHVTRPLYGVTYSQCCIGAIKCCVSCFMWISFLFCLCRKTERQKQQSWMATYIHNDECIRIRRQQWKKGVHMM